MQWEHFSLSTTWLAQIMKWVRENWVPLILLTTVRNQKITMEVFGSLLDSLRLTPNGANVFFKRSARRDGVCMAHTTTFASTMLSFERKGVALLSQFEGNRQLETSCVLYPQARVAVVRWVHRAAKHRSACLIRSTRNRSVIVFFFAFSSEACAPACRKRFGPPIL